MNITELEMQKIFLAFIVTISIILTEKRRKLREGIKKGEGYSFLLHLYHNIQDEASVLS